MSTSSHRATCVALALASLAPIGAFAQSSQDWQFQASIYGYLPAISGQTIFPPQNGGSSVSMDIDDVLSDLKMAFMGSFEARRGQWGVLADVVYGDLGDTNEQLKSFSLGNAGIPADVNAKVTYDFKVSIWTLAATYRTVADPAGFNADLVFGARVLSARPSLDYQLTGNIGSIPLPDRAGSREVSEQNWDFIVGVKGRTGFGQDSPWFIPYYLDVGTGESSFTWQAIAGVGYRFGWGDVVAAWRYTDYDMKSGNALQNLSTSGPAIAAVFRF